MSRTIQDLRVMVVDDNRHIRMIVKTILRSLGAKEVKDVADAARAFREMQNFSFDLVICDLMICDLMMTPIDGIEFVRMLPTAPDSPDRLVPIIMLTGHTELHRVAEARDAGVHEFLAKPVSADVLYERIGAMLENPRTFVKAKGYFGPDRRRRDDPKYSGPERRVSSQAGYDEERSGPSTDNDEIVEHISAFFAAARAAAPRGLGATVRQKIFLLGYLGGVIDYWSRTRLHMKPEFDFYFRTVLVKPEVIVRDEINMMLNSFAVFSSEPVFEEAWDRALQECAEATAFGPAYVPQGLRRFADPIGAKGRNEDEVVRI